MKFGTLLMWGFWLSAIGGLWAGFLWLRSRERNPAPRAAIEASLKRRLEAGELSEDEYHERLAELDRE